MIQPQEYILLENVEGYTVDHLVNAILEGHIDAYFEWPKAKQHVPMDFKGKLSRYVRIIQPVFKDGDDKLIFSKVAVLSSEGDIVSEPSLCFTAPIAGIRIKKEVIVKGKEPAKMHGPEAVEELCEHPKREGKTDKEIAQNPKLKPIPFEQKKYCKIRTLSERWDCSSQRIYALIGEGVLKLWHPKGKKGVQGTMVDVQSVLDAEKSGYI